MLNFLKNRFYIGEVVYRGEVHPGEQQPIVDKELFEAVQAKLKDRAVARKLMRSRSPSFLSGLLYDDRGNLMSPSHANKKGLRYRYYVSQAVLQNGAASPASPLQTSRSWSSPRFGIRLGTSIRRLSQVRRPRRWNSATAISWLSRSSASCSAPDIST